MYLFNRFIYSDYTIYLRRLIAVYYLQKTEVAKGTSETDTIQM